MEKISNGSVNFPADFVFSNALRLWGTQNPRFFEGTRVAKEAAALLKASTSARAAA